MRGLLDWVWPSSQNNASGPANLNYPEVEPENIQNFVELAIRDEPSPATSSTPSNFSTKAPAASRLGHPKPASLTVTKEAHSSPNPTFEANGSPPSEQMEGRGIITVLEESMNRGVIEGTYFFKKELLGPHGPMYKRGDKVNFKAERTSDSLQWEVTSISPYISPEEEEKQRVRRYNTKVGIVDSFEGDFAKLKYGSTYEDIQDIPKACLPTGYRVRPGDYLKVMFELDNLDDCTTGKILSVEPSKKKTIIGRVTTNRKGYMSINEHIYFDQQACRPGLKLHSRDVVRVEAVESKQEGFGWRAISVDRSSFPVYTAAKSQEEGWLEPMNVWSGPLEDLLEDKSGIKIMPRKLVNFGALKIGSTASWTIEIQNTSDSSITLKSVTVKGDQSVCKFEIDLARREAVDIITILVPGGSYNLTIKCTPIMLGCTRELCVFHFGSFFIGRYLVITSLSDEEDILSGIRKPVSDQETSFKRREGGGGEIIDKIIRDGKRQVVAGVQAVRMPFFMPRRLPNNSVPKFLWDIVRAEDEDHLLHAYPTLKDVLTFRNYREKFQVSLWLEEMENDILRRQYDMEHVVLRRVGDAFAFDVPGLKDISPALMQGDNVELYDSADTKGVKQRGHIVEFRGTDVFIKLNDEFTSTYDNTFVTIQFCTGRTTYKRCHHAVEQAMQYLGKEWLFPSEELQLQPPRIPFIEEEECASRPTGVVDESSSPSEASLTDSTIRSDALTTTSPPSLFRKATTQKFDRAPLLGRTLDRRSSSVMNFVSDTAGPAPAVSSACLKLKWINTALNSEQKNAVRRILRGQGRPLPYIIFGPPGTGKTVTVVEAVIQVHKLDGNSRILVVAPSNSAADVIAQHLVNSGIFLPGSFVRLVGFLRNEIQIPENIRDYCSDGDHLDTLARNRIIVTTCNSAGQFFSLGLDSGHFTHVFIDEAGYCTEPEALIASSLVALSKAGQVILAGDPQQLGPVLMSNIAANCGLSLSFLERLMALPLYSRNQEKFPDQKYNPVVLTKLVKNYRAHPTLLKLPSMLFYHDELESAADGEEINLCQSLDFLPAKGVPLVFHGLNGKTSREKDSPSWYNAAEVIQVVEYVRKLKKHKLENDDIGIITPYRKQVEKIRKALEMGLLQDDIPKVGSVEEFQGGERKVMIMSMVRSANEETMNKVIDRMSFLYSPKRFNVAITRAKAALIVIGNPLLLSHDQNWVKFLQYSLELGCYTGCNIPIRLDPRTQDFITNLGSDQVAPQVNTRYDSDGELIESEEEED